MNDRTPPQSTPAAGKRATASPRGLESPIGSRCRPGCRRPSPNQAHCTVCHRTLSGVTAFDAHRRDGWCVDPATIGLVEDDGVWATPEGHERRRADTARLAAMRQARSGALLEGGAG